MKRLLILTALAALSIASVGCRCTNPFTRGPSCPTCGTSGGMSAGYCGDAMGGAPMGAGMMPPEGYVVPGPQ